MCVFFQNCSDLLWKNVNVLVIKQKFWNSRLRGQEFSKFFSITRTMFFHRRSEQFWKQNTNGLLKEHWKQFRSFGRTLLGYKVEWCTTKREWAFSENLFYLLPMVPFPKLLPSCTVGKKKTNTKCNFYSSFCKFGFWYCPEKETRNMHAISNPLNC